MRRIVPPLPFVIFFTGFSILFGIAHFADADEPEHVVACPKPDSPQVTPDESQSDDVLEHQMNIRPQPRVLAPTPEGQLGFSNALEDESNQSMHHFHRALKKSERGEGQTRLLFFGASHVASDLFTGYLRRKLQTRFGDAGHGFVLPVHPWRSYRHRDVKIESNHKRWHSQKVRANTKDEDYYGLHGVFVESDRADTYGVVKTNSKSKRGANVSDFELYYLNQPNGGQADILIDNKKVSTITTAAQDFHPAYARFHVPDGPHSFKIKTQGDGPVRLFGVTLERENPGVIVDTLGINGARARYHLLWNDQIYREHLAKRNADLIVLAYGTNESGDDSPIERYRGQLQRVLKRVRDVSPEASCLLIGPSDRPLKIDDEHYIHRPRTSDVVQVQYEVAQEYGCAFFDLVAFQGGPMSMMEWSAHEPPFGAPDHIHYTRRGYERLGEVLYNALLEGYDSVEELETSSAP